MLQAATFDVKQKKDITRKWNDLFYVCVCVQMYERDERDGWLKVVRVQM